MSKAVVLVLYGWVTNCFRPQIVSHCLGIRSLEAAQLGGSGSRPPGGCSQVVRKQLDGAWRVSLQCPSDAGGRHWFLATCTFPYATWKLTFKTEATVAFITAYEKCHTITSAFFHRLYRSAQCRVRGAARGCDTRRQRLRGLSERLLPLPLNSFPEQCHRRSPLL